MTSPSPLDRRHWIKSATCVTTAMVLGDLVASRLMASTDPAGIALRADSSRDLFRVRTEMELEGNVSIPQSPVVTKEKVKQLPVTSKSVLDYEERVLALATDGAGQVAQRFFHTAQSTGKVGGQAFDLQLRDQSRDLRVHHQDSQWVSYSQERYLDGRELELLKVPANSLVVDALLPTEPIAVGGKYSIEPAVLAKWLSLAAVEQSTVEAVLVSATETEAKLELSGNLEGSVAGVPTSIELVAKLTFDRVLGACTWIAVGLKETRQIGKSEPGFEVAAKIRMLRKPMEAPVRLSQVPASDWAESVPADRLYAELSSTAVGYRVLMDRRWKIMNDAAGASMMRMVDQDSLVAQCNLHPLGKMAAGQQLTLEAFVGESRKSLGDRFREVLHSSEEVNDAGLRVMRVTIQGAVESVPVQWVFLQFSDDSGRRLLATLTVGNDFLETFAGTDQQLAASLQFLALADETLEVATQAGPSAELR